MEKAAMQIDQPHAYRKRTTEDDRYEATGRIDVDDERQPFFALNNSRAKVGFFDAKNGFKLARHLVSCFFTIAHLAATIYYVLFKSMLYARHFDQVFSAPWLLLIFICELAYLFGSIMSAIDNCMPPTRRPHPGYLDTHDRRKCPMVHILLPCCKEPTDVPLEGIRAALDAMDYPKDRYKVLVLDDGGDDALQAECAALQAEHAERLVYLRRKKIKGVPHHFKCGNLNYGLQHSDAEFVVMMDADMILHPTFLRRLLPYIVDSPQVSFVQIPQSFYNLPRGDPLNDACLLGYNRMLGHRDSLGMASCVGTGAIFRRKHLDAIGGFQPQSITEDTMTAYVLFNQGFKSVYLCERLQIGLTPWTFEGYVKQRARWGQGAMQQFVACWRIMLWRGSRLNLVQKCLFFWHTGYYFLSIINIVLMTTLLASLAFHLRLTVGNDNDNVQLIKYLAMALVLGRISWLCLWLDIPLPIQSKNREESHFWWMTPFFFTMCMKSIFAYDSTFQFIPTSNIDRGAAAAAKKLDPSSILKPISIFKPVAAHLAYAIAVGVTVGGRGFQTFASNIDCNEAFLVVGLSVFLVSTAAHMLLPVIFLLTSPNFKPSQRRSLLRYNADGIPSFSPEQDCLPEWTWSVIFYELLSITNLVFWIVVLIYALQIDSGSDTTINHWCRGTSFLIYR